MDHVVIVCARQGQRRVQLEGASKELFEHAYSRSAHRVFGSTSEALQHPIINRCEIRSRCEQFSWLICTQVLGRQAIGSTWPKVALFGAYRSQLLGCSKRPASTGKLDTVYGI